MIRLRVVIILLFTWLLAGCGGDTSTGSTGPASSTSSTTSTTQPQTLQVTIPFSSEAASKTATGLPDSSSAVVVHILDATGHDVVPPVTQPHTAGAEQQTLQIEGVPPGDDQVLVWGIDGQGRPNLYATRAVQVTSGVTIVSLDGAATLTSVSVTPADATILVGTKQAYTASAAFDGGANVNVTGLAAFASASPTTATVDASGVASGVSGGTTTISATFNGAEGHTGLIVSATLSGLAVTPPDTTISAGLTRQFTATASFDDGATQDVTQNAAWTSSSPAVAGVSASGLATGLTAGATTITASLGGFTASGTLQVSSAALVSIAVTPANPTINKGDSLQLTATGSYTDGSSQDLTTQVTWSTSPTGFATVSASGLAAGAAVGATTVTATLGTVSGATGLTVGPAVPKTVAVDPPTAMSAPGTTRQFRALVTFTDGTVQDLTASVTWSETGGGGITVDASGLATIGATAVGVGTITATTGNNVSSSGTLGAQSFVYALENGTALTVAYADAQQLGSNTFAFQEATVDPTTAGNPLSAAFNPSGATIYVGTGTGGNAVASFAIDVSSGAPLSNLTSTVSLPYPPSGIGVLPDRSALVSQGIRSGNSQVDVYALSQNGNLGSSQATFPISHYTSGLSIDPQNKYAFLFESPGLANITTVDAFPITTTNFQSTLGAPVQSAVNNIGAPQAVSVVDPTGRFLYVATENEVHVLQITPATGAVSVVQNVAAQGANALALHPTGNALYAAFPGTTTLFRYSLTNGLVSGGAPIAAVAARALSVDPTGLHLYVDVNGTHYLAYRLNPFTGVDVGLEENGFPPFTTVLDFFSP
jgi:hypothetical protein